MVAEITLREITIDNVDAVCDLSRTLTEHQQGLLSDNAVSIAQAHYYSNCWMRAIYADEMLVGFMMLGDNAEKPHYRLVRLMIAGSSQGQGYGRRAAELAIEYVRTRPKAVEFFTSCESGSGSPEPFYRKLGFVPTGRMQTETEMEMVLKL